MASKPGLYDKQRVFAVLETTPGTIAFPTAADYILPCGDATIKQAPAMKDSKEKSSSLDVTNQVASALPPAEWEVPMCLRPGATAGAKPQGAALFKSLQGLETIAASTSVTYAQATSCPSFTLFVETDHMVQGVSGATTDKLEIAPSNVGEVEFNFSGKGMLMFWAGTCTLAAGAATGQKAVTVPDAGLYSVGAFIHNVTKNDHATNGYQITAINYATNVLTVDVNLAVAWAIGDVVAGYLPAASPIGTPLENRHTRVFIGGVESSFLNAKLAIEAEKDYPTKEVGNMQPTFYVERKRSIGGSLAVYFRAADVARFKTAMLGQEIALKLVYGASGGRQVEQEFPRMKVSTPVIGGDGPCMTGTMSLKALGSGSGENSHSLKFV